MAVKYDRYAAEIELYEREARPWHERADKIYEVYKDSKNKDGKTKRFNILWSNVQTLKPALYARLPQPEVERRFKDSDKVGRVASEVLERAVSYTIDCHGQDKVLKQCVEDRLLPGRGVMWHRYKPTFGPSASIDPITEEPEDEVTYEQVLIDYVYWKDFGHNICRTWSEVWLVWRRVYMTRSQLIDRFGEEEGKKIPLDYQPKGVDKKKQDPKKACIYEAWDSEKELVVFLSKAKDYEKIIQSQEDPLELEGFPCPEPLFATIANDSLLPTPDYALYQTQAREIEDLTARINALQKALKIVGFYNSSAPELANTLNDGYENKMVPVDEWAMYAEKGGMAGNVDFFPVEEVAKVVVSLYEAREKSKEDLYELTGIADIIRGHSDPRETATAQQIKGRFAVLRISDSQEEVQRFARDSIRIIAEIISKHFALETIQQISGIRLLTAQQKAVYSAIMQQQAMVERGMQGPVQQLPEEITELMDEPTWEEVVSLLRDDALRNFRIEVETDSTIRVDEEADRAERMEFLNTAGVYIEKTVQASQIAPEVGVVAAEMLMFAIRGYKAGRTLEPIFEEAIKEMRKPKPPQPNPEVMKIQAEAKLKEQDAQNKKEIELAKQQAQAMQQEHQSQLDDARADRDHQREMQEIRYKTDQEIKLAREKAIIDANAKVEVARIQAQDNQQDREHQERTAQSETEESRNYRRERSESRSTELQDALKVLEAAKELRD